MVKNLLTLSVVGLTFFFFGWWVYNAFPLFPLTGGIVGPWTSPDSEGIVGEVLGLVQASYPWSPAMGPNVADNLTGVFWFAFALFSMTTASILSGAVIERIKVGAYAILAVVLGSFTWVVAAAWGWHPYGWFLTNFGYHDFGCSAVLHGVSGFFALGVLINLGPRIGKFDADGKPNAIMPHNLPLTMVGLMLIFVGFYAFLAACVIKAGIDDAVGAFAVHGYCGLLGAMTVGVMASGYPQGDGIPLTGFFGQLVGTFVCTVILGFIPGYGVSFVLKKLGMLRVSPEEEIAGLDIADFGLEGSPEYPILPEQNGHTPKPVVAVSKASPQM